LERTYDILVRVYTPKPEEVPSRVERAIKHGRQIIAVSKEFPQLKRANFLVPEDYDCGQTFGALVARFRGEGFSRKQVGLHAYGGYHSCEALNKTLLGLSESNVLIVSGKAMTYLTALSLQKIDDAFARGAKASGLAVGELRDIVLSGRLQNTFTAWDRQALLLEEGFDNRKDVEEIAPLIRLARRYGKCIAPIDVEGEGLDVHMSPTALERHRHVMGEKVKRQQEDCERLGADFDFIREHVME